MPLGMVRARIVGSPPMVELERDGGVDDDFWYGLPVQMTSAVPPRSGHHRMIVPLERFLASRRWLRAACVDREVGIEFDDALLAALGRAKSEREAISRHLDRSTTEFAGGPVNSLLISPESRYVRDLRPFQLRDLEKLSALEHGANFSVPGAGKTAVTYALYEIERIRRRVDRIMIVAPLSAYDAWEDEASRCFRTPPRIHRFIDHVPTWAEAVLVNYQRLTNYLPQLTSWLNLGAPQLVLDEAHRMKRGRDGKWGAACLDLSQLAQRRDVLTGTPAPQGPSDLVAIMEFTWPTQARRILPAVAFERDPPADAMSAVNEAIQPLFVRTRKSELRLEAPQLHVEMVRMKRLQTDIYDALRNRYAGLFELSQTDQTMLAQMGEVTMYLLEAATNPAVLKRRASDDPVSLRYPTLTIPTGSHLGDLISRYSEHEIPAKFERLASIVRTNSSRGRKTLVWSNFVGNLLYLEQLLAKYRPALIYGEIPNDDGRETAGLRTREGELVRFRRDHRCQVLLANPAAMSEGVSLHEVCHDAVYVDRTFNAGQYLQSLDRIHRLGLRPGVETNVTFLVSVGSIDEAVDGRVSHKAERLGAMLDDPDVVAMSLPNEEDYGEIIEDAGDLDALFEHLAAGS